MKKTILISTLVSNGAGSAQILDNSSVTVMSKADELEIQIRDQATAMFHDSNPNLEQCYHLLPGLQGTIVEDSCKEEDESITCNFKCDGDENIEQDRLLGSNIIFGGYEIKCQCHQIIGGNRVYVPCTWSGIPSCPVRSPPAILPEYGEQCGELSDQHGEWKCEGKSCYLHCNHGYIASDTGTKMSPKCSCSKFGNCSWYKPAKCVRINPESGKCKAEQALIGEMGCTGYTNGELCELDCPTNYKSDQYGIRRCECDSSGACDWLGDRGHCEEDFSFPGLESISSSSLLSNQKCKKLPETEMGFWQCDPEQTCTLVCPPGYEANQVVEIDCLCSNGSCLYQNQNSPDRRFQVHGKNPYLNTSVSLLNNILTK
jgi:hypothetical protein